VARERGGRVTNFSSQPASIEARMAMAMTMAMTMTISSTMTTSMTMQLRGTLQLKLQPFYQSMCRIFCCISSPTNQVTYFSPICLFIFS